MEKAQGQRLAIAGAVSTIAEPLAWAAHAGGVGVIAGLAAGAVAYLITDEIQQQMRTGEEEVIPSPVAHKMQGVSSLGKRLLVGKSVRGDVGDVDAGDELSAPTFLPVGPLYFSNILKTFTPSLERIYLATLPNGKPVFIPARNLCHTALAGATRGGKDHLIRMLMSQLCYAGAKVYLLDPNYTRYDLEAVDPFGRSCPEDWTPFEAYLKNDPREMTMRARKYLVIEHYLEQAFNKVEQRLEDRGSGTKLGAPHFLFVNEMPAIIDEVPKTLRYLKKILREGAKVGVFMVNASQDFHVSTIFKEIGGGVRKCYRTAFDVGSDPDTQRALGLLPGKIAGKGNGSLRCDDILSLARLPYVDNEALYGLLGPSTYASKELETEREEVLPSYASYGAQEASVPETPRRHYAASGYEAYTRKKASRKAPVYTARESVPETPRLSPDEQLAYSTYADGMSWRDLAKQLDWGHDKAYRIRRQLIERGLVTEDSRKL